jgi:hypothetical protein
VIDLSAYPSARKRGAGAAVNSDVQLSPIPRTRYFTFLWAETATSRRTVSTPRLTGPVVIKDIDFYSSTINATHVKSIEVGYSLVPVTEAGVALATARPYTTLTELIDPFAQGATGVGVGIEQLTTPATNVKFSIALDLIIDQAECYVCVALVNTSSNGQLWHGKLRVVENVSREALSFFL